MKRVDVTYAVISHDAFFQTTLQEQLNDKGNFDGKQSFVHELNERAKAWGCRTEEGLNSYYVRKLLYYFVNTP